MSRAILMPFLGFLSLKDLPSQLIVGIWVLLPALVGGVFAGLDLWNSLNSRVGRDALLVLCNVGLIAVLPRASWVDPLAMLRIALGLHITILVWLAGAQPRLLPYAVALWIPSSLVLLLVPNMM